MRTMTAAELEELNRRCCLNIWNMAGEGTHTSSLSPRVITPEYRRGLPRISEQEARFALAEALSGTSAYYSVETPTKCKYCFEGSGDRPMSARTDLSLYVAAPDGLIHHQANVEFKAHMPSESRPEKPGPIRKDIEKLVREQECCDIWGNWFHLLKNTDSGTIPKLLEKFQRALDEVPHSHKVEILFCLCVVEKKQAYLGWYRNDGGGAVASESFFVSVNRLPGAQWRKIEASPS
jgi:hypothetical protein